jgi:hypothetical protein
MSVQAVVARSKSEGSGHQAGFLERQARRPIEQAGRVTVTEINQKIRPPTITGEKGRVDRGIVKTGHRTDVETQRSCRDQQVGALQSAVAERRRRCERVVAGEPGDRVGVMRK